jgi:MoaA/NifB/PqqE/SkfB family radical SAM enzyme
MGKGPTKRYHNSIHEAYVDGTLTCLKPEVIRQAIDSDFPLVLNIEPTNACNLHCTFCPRERTAARQGENYIELNTFKKIIDEATEYHPLFMLNLHKDGEPLLHDELPEMVAYARKKDVAGTIHLNTNGMRLGGSMGQRLLESGIDDITISVDAAYPETYRQLKRSRHFDTLIKNIESFIEHRDRVNSETTIRVKIMEFDAVAGAEIDAFHDQWTGIADEVQVTGVHNWSGAISGLRVTDETSSERYPCALLWYALAVNSNGDVSICNVDWDYSGVVGSVHQKSLHAIWNDLPLRKIRRAHLDAHWDYVPVCDSCVVWTSVGNLKSYLQTRVEFIV